LTPKVEIKIIIIHRYEEEKKEKIVVTK